MPGIGVKTAAQLIGEYGDLETLLERGFNVYAINPKQLDRFRDRFSPAGAKDDSRDAETLASSLRTDGRAFRELAFEEPALIELREYSRLTDELTRENVLKQATNLKNVQLDLSLPGIVANTTPNDYRVNKQLQMMKFNGERWELFGPILEDAGPAG